MQSTLIANLNRLESVHFGIKKEWKKPLFFFWRRGQDSNLRLRYNTRFPSEHFRPLGHLSIYLDFGIITNIILICKFLFEILKETKIIVLHKNSCIKTLAKDFKNVTI